MKLKNKMDEKMKKRIKSIKERKIRRRYKINKNLKNED